VIRTLLNIQSLDVLSGDGQTADFRRVRCPVRDRTVTLEQCLSCPESEGVARDATGRIEYASCRRAGAGAEARRDAPGAVMNHTPVSAVMTSDVFAVRPDVSLEALMDVLLERGIGGAPVVDEEGRPVGVVSKTDLLDQRFVAGDTGEAIAPGRQVSRGHFRVEVGPGVHAEALPYDSVADAMTRAAITLPEDAPAAEAAAIMVRQGIHRVLVVADDGKLSGIVTSSDIVRWVARRARGLPGKA
jgi:CBS domain-containing protein